MFTKLTSSGVAGGSLTKSENRPIKSGVIWINLKLCATAISRLTRTPDWLSMVAVEVMTICPLRSPETIGIPPTGASSRGPPCWSRSTTFRVGS